MNKLYGIIGYPIGHSMSPLMHNDAFLQLGLNGYYHAFNVREDQLKETIAAFRVLNVSGFNVTIPHKVSIMKYLDEVDVEAKQIGAVNTVVNVDGRLIGYNTDGKGYLKSLLEVIVKPLEESTVLVIGAGGAARGVVSALMNYGVAQLMIANRTDEKATQIKNDYGQKNIEVISFEEAESNIGVFDILINTTSVGMSPNIENIPLSVEKIKQNVVLSDLIYNPLKTRWLQLGEEKGAIIHNGVGMFVEQGALAFQKWTGLNPDTKKMKEIVLKQLGGSSC
ncbi:shikimate dehydrogenase [Anaerobacillus alkalidiazotrophicus]|uniref:Shikimate dehydrogenase (NADP(+)) n=1 Tax=Anaerobacillus alkalidiazotrophicus TaxID=472963 RepID=A0A1S2MBM7_9BACI|nr:shikimate dehydrogenase [Anaerobacillus alkalidiazotrophicus]OIJ22099.1 shikimate dehydrogenase [Anaerobacillus alkalidiazotrophicus]